MRSTRRGFTLIEILTAVGIIAALLAMFFIGFKVVSQKTKEDQTKVGLQVLRGMLEEYKVRGGDMSKIDKIYTAALPAPAGVAEGMADRDGTAVTNTRRVIKLLLTIPENQKILTSMPGAEPPPAGVDPGKVQGPFIWGTDDGIVLLDAHQNPIIFVPKQGLSKVVIAGGGEQTIFGPGKRGTEGPPFFASGGADGSFQKGDDNKYSFE